MKRSRQKHAKKGTRGHPGGGLALLVWGLMLWAGIGAANGAEKVVLQLKWRHQFQFAGYYAAVEKGYYKQMGLDVELREAQPGRDPLHEVLDGHAEYGVGTSNILLLRGNGDPVVVLAVIYQHSPFVLLTSKQSGIRDIHDLATRPIMMEPDAAELLAYFQREGIDPRKLTLQTHSFDVKDLIEGRAGAMSAYSTDEPFFMKQAGLEYLIFTPRAAGIDFYGDNLFTTEKELNEHPERVRSFVAATLLGWEYAMAHPHELVDMILEKYNRGKTREQLLFEAEETAKLVHPELIELGYINPGRWKDIAQTYESLKMLPANFSLAGFLFERSPRLNLTWFYWVGGGILFAVLGVAGWSLLTWNLNRQLRKEVKAREEAEALARAESAAKTRFHAILAHEVRAPMSGILSSLWMYHQSEVGADREGLIKTIENSTANLLRMVDSLLDHASIESNKVELEMVPVDVQLLVREVVELFQSVAQAKGIKLSCEPGDEQIPKVLMTDPVRLRQILSNLMSNAIKFTDAGEVQVCVSVVRGTGDGGSTPYNVSFEVKDTGQGIPQDKLASIFEPYVRASHQHGGSGLGLAISSQLARLLGGQITVRSELNEGSTFTLTIRAEDGPRFKGF